MANVLVAGGGGFIGGHLVANLIEEGHLVRAVDLKPLDCWYQAHDRSENIVGDLSLLDTARAAASGQDVIYNLACDMGGMGFIENNRALCMLSVLINTHLLMAAKEVRASRYFYSSSACVYAASHQDSPSVKPLSEADAYPADPEDGYGWEKLFGERMCRHFRDDFGLETRVARYHNAYGPFGTWEGGREKAPAAICRKVARAKLTGRHEIEIWGDGAQTRSFMFIDDCVYGTRLIADGAFAEPLNLGSAELVTIDQLVTIIEAIANVQLDRTYNASAPQGVRGRNSDNTLIKSVFGWEPSVTLKDGLTATYQWIERQVIASAQ